MPLSFEEQLLSVHVKFEWGNPDYYKEPQGDLLPASYYANREIIFWVVIGLLMLVVLSALTRLLVAKLMGNSDGPSEGQTEGEIDGDNHEQTTAADQSENTAEDEDPEDKDNDDDVTSTQTQVFSFPASETSDKKSK